MVRSMSSGVAGMKAHQTKMDVIGNNISNVNTYGFKSSRVTFRDVYYQSLRNAAAGTSNRGGINPTQIGYGAKLASVDLLMTQSSMTNTGNPLDVAITGEGFLQVQDSEGNMFFTKAGMLDIDSNGNLVDLNGNFILGVSGSPVGQAADTGRIQFSIPAVDPTSASIEETINGKKIRVSATNKTNDGNVTFNFQSDDNMPIGQKAKAVVSASGITVRMNAKEVFADLDEMQKVVNQAITDANGGKAHPAGEFKLSMDDKFPTGGLTGAEICGKNFGYKLGSLSTGTNALFGGWTVSSVGNTFKGDGDATYSLVHTPAAGAVEESFTITATIGGQSYTSKILASQMKESGSVVLFNANNVTDKSDCITMTFPSYETVKKNANDPTQATLTYTAQTVTGAAKPSAASRDLGFSNRPFKLEGGTVGGPQTVKDLSGIAIGADGVIVAIHPVHGRIEVGRIDLATFENPKGLLEAGDSYFTSSENSGAGTPTKPGEGGSGEIKNSSLELSNVDLSQEFSDMITTQRGFQANSRLITVSDTMLEELINLKR